jgi:urease alpha subunit
VFASNVFSNAMVRRYVGRIIVSRAWIHGVKVKVGSVFGSHILGWSFSTFNWHNVWVLPGEGRPKIQVKEDHTHVNSLNRFEAK